MKRFEIPQEVLAVVAELKKAYFDAYLVGGCVRDVVLGIEPKDWDVATNAKPEEIQKVFSRRSVAEAGTSTRFDEAPARRAENVGAGTVYENNFGTVGVKTDSEDERLKIVEVTTFRLEGKYTDKRHPDDVRFAKTVEEDLSRRDFTVNAIALALTFDQRLKTVDSHKLSVGSYALVDPYKGQLDIKDRIIRTVGDPLARFDEDALRLMRAVRLSTELDFQIEFKTRRAIEEKAGELEMIAKERIRDEFIKILESQNGARGIILLEELGLLKYVAPELCEGVGVGQNKHHIYTVFEHHVRSLDYAVTQGHSLALRVAALLHDIGKPKTKHGDGLNSTFHGHEIVGAKMVVRVLDRLKFSKDFTERVAHLVRYHMFYYNVGEVSDAGVRRFLRRVGPEYVPELIQLREADRIGSGVPKAIPYKLRHFLFMIEKVKHDPISPKMLKVNGEDVMELLKIEPGPRIGYILAALLEDVLDDPNRNTKEYLEARSLEFGKLAEQELKNLALKAREKKEGVEKEIEDEIKERFRVR